MNSDFTIFQSKLKRNNISCSIEGQKVIFGKASFNVMDFALLLTFFVVSAVIFYFSFPSGTVRWKSVFLGGITMSAGFFYLKRMLENYASNSAKKILYNERLQIGERYFDSNNISKIYGEIIEIREDEVYQTTLFIENLNGDKTLILQLDESAESLAQNELNWMVSFFKKQLKV